MIRDNMLCVDVFCIDIDIFAKLWRCRHKWFHLKCGLFVTPLPVWGLESGHAGNSLGCITFKNCSIIEKINMSCSSYGTYRYMFAQSVQRKIISGKELTGGVSREFATCSAWFEKKWLCYVDMMCGHLLRDLEMFFARLWSPSDREKRAPRWQYNFTYCKSCNICEPWYFWSIFAYHMICFFNSPCLLL